MILQVILLAIILSVFFIDNHAAKKNSTDLDVYTNHDIHKKDKKFSIKRIKWVVTVVLLSLIFLIQFTKPPILNKTARLEINDFIDNHYNIVLVDYSSSKHIASKLKKYNLQNLNGEWIYLSNVSNGENKFSIDEIHLDRFIQLLQYDKSKDVFFVIYPFRLSQNNVFLRVLKNIFGQNILSSKVNLQIIFRENEHIKGFDSNQYLKIQQALRDKKY